MDGAKRVKKLHKQNVFFIRPVIWSWSEGTTFSAHSVYIHLKLSACEISNMKMKHRTVRRLASCLLNSWTLPAQPCIEYVILFCCDLLTLMYLTLTTLHRSKIPLRLIIIKKANKERESEIEYYGKTYANNSKWNRCEYWRQQVYVGCVRIRTCRQLVRTCIDNDGQHVLMSWQWRNRHVMSCHELTPSPPCDGAAAFIGQFPSPLTDNIWAMMFVWR